MLRDTTFDSMLQAEYFCREDDWSKIANVLLERMCALEQTAESQRS